MKVRFKRLHPDAVIPKYAKPGDAGVDLTAISVDWNPNGYYSYDTGLAVEIPEGYVGLIFPRSSIYKTDLKLSNSVGVIDSGYRGSIKANFYYDDFDTTTPYKVGDRIMQLIILPYPQIELEEVDELSDTSRGSGGFGSSGK